MLTWAAYIKLMVKVTDVVGTVRKFSENSGNYQETIIIFEVPYFIFSEKS